MKTTGVIGLGNMGSGLAKNLMKNGFTTYGLDISPDRMAEFAERGGKPAASVAELGAKADSVFVMVMNGDQAKSVIFGQDGLISHMAKGGTIIVTATIKPKEMREIGEGVAGSGIYLIDSPVSGGFAGAQGGTLTMMAAAPPAVLDDNRAVMESVSGSIHRVGEKPGEGQTVKACLQSLIGPIFTATFEACALAAKAGVPGQVLHNVFSTSGAGCGLVNTAISHIIDREFDGTGSHISTMHKDLTISQDMALELGVPMQTMASAMQMFQAGITKYPEGDNWVCTRLVEEITGAELHRDPGSTA